MVTVFAGGLLYVVGNICEVNLEALRAVENENNLLSELSNICGLFCPDMNENGGQALRYSAIKVQP